MNFLHHLLFKFHFYTHVFCLIMLLILTLFINISFGLLMSLSLGFSLIGIIIHFYIKLNPQNITKDIYAITAVTSNISLSIISKILLFIAIRIDFMNFIYFLISLFIFLIVTYFLLKKRNRKKMLPLGKIIKRAMLFAVFLLLSYQIILAYFLRPNFLVNISLIISNINLMMLIFTYFDLKRLYKHDKL